MWQHPTTMRYNTGQAGGECRRAQSDQSCGFKTPTSDFQSFQSYGIFQVIRLQYPPYDYAN